MDAIPIPNRKTTRIHKFDYSSENYYFVTICTHEKKCIFGKPSELSLLGKIANQDMLNLEKHYYNVHVDGFCVMPNHIHAIIVIKNQDHNERTPSLNNIIGQYKSGVSRKAKMLNVTNKIWQRSFHDHVIRSQTSYEKIWDYVQYNHKKWESDCFYMDE